MATMNTDPGGYSSHQTDLIEENRAFLNKNFTAIQKQSVSLKHAVAMQITALVAEFLVFFGVMLWSANKPVGTDANGVTIWEYTASGIAVAVFVAFLAPLCTYMSAPLRDEVGKVRTVAIVSWFGMLLVWFPSVMEFIAQSSIESRVVDKFGIDPEYVWIVNLVIFLLGIALFSVFNHVYREAKQRAAELRKQIAATDEAKHFEQTVTDYEQEQVRINHIQRSATEWDANTQKANTEAIKKMLETVFHIEGQKRYQTLIENPPHPHSSKRIREDHQKQLDAIRKLFVQPGIQPKEIS